MLATELQHHEQEVMHEANEADFMLGVGRQLQTPQGALYGMYARSIADGPSSGSLVFDILCHEGYTQEPHTGRSLGMLSMVVAPDGVYPYLAPVIPQEPMAHIRDFGFEEHESKGAFLSFFQPLGAWVVDMVQAELDHGAVVRQELSRIKTEQARRTTYVKPLREGFPLARPTTKDLMPLEAFVHSNRNSTVLARYSGQPGTLLLHSQPRNIPL